MLNLFKHKSKKKEAADAGQSISINIEPPTIPVEETPPGVPHESSFRRKAKAKVEQLRAHFRPPHGRAPSRSHDEGERNRVYPPVLATNMDTNIGDMGRPNENNTSLDESNGDQTKKLDAAKVEIMVKSADLPMDGPREMLPESPLEDSLRSKANEKLPSLSPMGSYPGHVEPTIQSPTPPAQIRPSHSRTASRGPSERVKSQEYLPMIDTSGKSNVDDTAKDRSVEIENDLGEHLKPADQQTEPFDRASEEAKVETEDTSLDSPTDGPATKDKSDKQALQDNIQESKRKVQGMRTIGGGLQKVAEHGAQSTTVLDKADTAANFLRILNAFDLVVKALSDAHPYAKVALSVLSWSSQVILTQANRDKSIQGLQSRIAEAYEFMLGDGRLEQIFSMKDILSQANKVMSECAQFIQDYSQPNFLSRLGKGVFSDSDEAIANHTKAINDLMQLFQQYATRDTLINTHDILTTTRDILTTTRDIRGILQDNRQLGNNQPHFENMIINKECNDGNHGGTYGIANLKEYVSFRALHDSAAQDPTRRVHPGTRQYVLNCIRDWIDNLSGTEPIFWLHGPAGVGKSSIAQTIARSYSRDKLAATFFFYRSDPSRNDGNRLFTTLAWQFAYTIPATKTALIRSLNERPDIPMTDVETQFEELIVKPFLALKRPGISLPVPVVIIDGVDECADDSLQRRFLKIIGNAVRDGRVPLRFLICSRREAHIQDVIDTFRSLTLPLDLTSLADADEDIEKYLKAEFSRIATEQDLDPTWPGEQITEEFVYKASGQFVYASTVVKRLGDEQSSAETQLDIIRGLKPRSAISPFAELDELYKDILRRQRDPVFLKDFLSLLIGRNGMALTGLHEDDAMLMNVSNKELHRKLRGMHSLLKLEPYIDVHHRSFLEFLQDLSRSGEYHISDQAGTRRYWDFVVASLVRYVMAVIKQHDDHKTHFSPQFHRLTSSYSEAVKLPVEEWQEALQPLLDIWNKLLALPNFRSSWELLPCNKCTGFCTMRDLLLYHTFRLEVSDPGPDSALAAELHTDGPEEIDTSVTSLIPTEIETDAPEVNLKVCLSSLLHRLRRRKLGISPDVDTVQLTCSLLRFDHNKTAMRLRSISDAQNLVDLIDELINNKYNCNDDPDILRQAVHLALEIYARVPVLPRSLFSNKTVGPDEYAWIGSGRTEVNLTELLFQNAFMGKFLDPNFVVRVSWVYEASSYLVFVGDKVNEDNESLNQWRRRSKPSSATKIRVMLEVAKAIQYFHSMGIVLHDTIDSDLVFLDSEFHARFQFLGLTIPYVKVTQWMTQWHSLEANIFFFGCLFYEMFFDVEINYFDRLDNKRDTIAKRPRKPEIRDDAWQLIQRCCAEDPKTRPIMNDIVQEMKTWDVT